MASITTMSIEEYCTKFIKTHMDFTKYLVVIISKDIITDTVCDTDDEPNVGFNYNITDVTKYISKYKHIEFIPSLYPSASVVNYIQSGKGDTACKIYSEYINRDTDRQVDICSLIDLVIRYNRDIILIQSNDEQYQLKLLTVIALYIQATFGLDVLDYKLITNKNGVSEFIPYTKSEIEEARIKLNEFLRVKLDIKGNNPTDLFINRFAENLEDKFKEMLTSKSMEELEALGKEKGFTVNMKKTKEETIDHIMDLIKRGKIK